MMMAVLGQASRATTLPNAVNLTTGSPTSGKPNLAYVQPGSWAISSPGWVNFPVPNYNSLTVTLRGAGGGGSSDALYDDGINPVIHATAGETSLFGGAMSATGGAKGVEPGNSGPPTGAGGSGGSVTPDGGGAG